MSKIKFLGRQENVESIINIFNIGILMSNNKVHGEGISNSIMEYMILGKPVIATIGGGTRELVVDQQTGFLVKSESPEKLAEQILLLLKDTVLANKIGKAGKKRIISEFGLDKMVNKYYKLYQTMIGVKI